MLYITYNLETGKIMGYCDADNMTSADVSPDNGLVVADETHRWNYANLYVPAGVITLRPSMPLTLDRSSIPPDDSTVATVSGVPSGTQVDVADASGRSSYIVTDGSMELVSSTPGKVTMTFTLFPYKTTTIDINVA